ncbi:hypothetical protein [Chryseobacterium indoltheticum]|uniref:hypothetical protein n=1 Tax=Chryseobacterium indoltheticum TaxID=254 RepID=UPI003F498B46
MFRAALLLNPNNIELKQRLYKEYFNACLGNKKIKTLINFNGRLLADVKQKYESFVQSHPNNKNLQKQHAKVCRLLDCNADNQNPLHNTVLKNYTKEQYKNFKNRFATLTSAEVEAKLNDLLVKPYSKDRKQHIRELYKISFQKLRKDKNNTEALAKALAYHNNVENNDPLFLKYIRDLSRYEKKFDTLITIETQNHTLKIIFGLLLLLLMLTLKRLSIRTRQSVQQ